MQPMSNEIIRLLETKGNDVVLDVASGTGEPGLTIAAMLNGGKVVITDLAEDMLKVAQEKATQKVIKNIETRVCDVSALPFDDETFDAISCRLGFMFFPDMNLAVNEMVRVLKPGGRIAATVWNVPEKNFWVTAMGGTINKNMQIPPPPPGAPGMFRCSKPGLVQDMFRQAGLKNTFEKEVNGLLKSENAETYWNMMTDVAAPFVAALSKADDAMKDKIKREVFELVNEKYPNGNVNIDSSALIIYGEK
ncbi:MAG: class I SAM-dependent methyltransferase [Bacteroidota bacterium]|nr:class I SAM-dependent methyltransferase [Bacteroidota bacterium]